jgi:DAK2 domain fusion protein YloV
MSIKSEPFLTPKILKDVICNFFASLQSHQELINRLNVYPVPDGDTGSNMVLTVKSAIDELQNTNDEPANIVKAISHGSLMGARGNSGIITSQILRSFCNAIVFDADVFNVCNALKAASEAAYKAVAVPIEGTMITVIKQGALAACSIIESSKEQPSLLAVATAARDGALKALMNTPEELPILAASNVVDAGGCGVVLFLDAIVVALGGKPLGSLHDYLPEKVRNALLKSQSVTQLNQLSAQDADSSIDTSSLLYEVMFLLEIDPDKLNGFKEVWETMGDSVVIVGDEGLYNCHIHTPDVGSAIEAAIDVGRPRNIRVTYLEQVEEEKWVTAAQQKDALKSESLVSQQSVNTAIITVANGEGIKRIFNSLGVKVVIPGGQTMNPSTREFLEAINLINADNVIEAFGALLEYDPNSDLETNFNAMEEKKKEVFYAEVVMAVRDATTEAGEVSAGDWMAITKNAIEVVGKSLEDVLCRLVDKVIKPNTELITVFEGQGAHLNVTRHLESYISEKYPLVEVEIHQGGQPFYPYLLSVE